MRLPFDAEYVHGYLSEVLKETVGGTKDPHIRELMAWLLQPDAVIAQPAAVVEKESDYWSRGHFYEGKRHALRPLVDLDKLPIGTKLYAAGVQDLENKLRHP